MRAFPRSAAAGAALLGLSACIELNPTSVTRLEPKGDPFAAALHAEYAELAVKESALYDWGSAGMFARKARESAAGRPVAAEMPEIWGIGPEDRADLEIARARMVELVEAGRAAAPRSAASAQAAYDCWVEEQGEGHRLQDIETCRERFEMAMAEVETLLQPAVLPAAGDAAQPEREFELFFPLNAARPKPEDRLVLAEVVRIAGLVAPLRVAVSGHADRAGDPAYNAWLSKARAEAVAEDLVGLGLDPRLVEVAAFGESVLAVPTPDGTAHDRNRRVVIRLL